MLFPFFKSIPRYLCLLVVAFSALSCGGNHESDSQEPSFSPVIPEGTTENASKQASDVTILFDWNATADMKTSWNGWLWVPDVAFGNEGWILDSGGRLGEGQVTYFGVGPRSFDKSDYKDDNFAEIDSAERAPSTFTGSSFTVFDNPQNEVVPKQATWWLYYDGRPLIDKEITTESTDRMSFYIKVEGMTPLNEDGLAESISPNFHVGTYLCWDTGLTAYSTGDGCPREGPGNQHYYHHLGLNPGAWIHVELDDHPNHHRGAPGNSYHENNPVASEKKNYFAQLSRFYFEIRSPQPTNTQFWVDEVSFYSTSNSHEPNQNDESVTSLWVGYWPANDYWEIGFKDGGNFSVGANKFSTFEIRWSTRPITNENYNQANIVKPMFYSGPKYVGEENPHYLRRTNDFGRNVWTRFTLPEEISTTYQMVYFAVKDVTNKNKNKGSDWPWNRADHDTKVSSNIRSINYALRPFY